jgi:uncharacterized protein YqjF (DUF2071 family)
MGQSWLDLLFAHWRVDPAQLAKVVPPQLPLDIVDGSAWIGVTPFEVRALRLRLTPPAPFVSAFPELNVRTYVTVGGKPGIYFLSLDAGSALAVASARRAYRLPYYSARMRIERTSEGLRYQSVRKTTSGRPAALTCRYSPIGPAFQADAGSIEAALTERYCAYTLDDEGAVQRIQIHHRPWKLRRARAEFELNTMGVPLGIEPAGEPVLHLSARQDVVIWPLERA